MESLLDKLTQHQTEILQGEIIALFHNLAKFSDGFLLFQLDDEAKFHNPFQLAYPSDIQITRVDSATRKQFANDENANPQIHVWDELLSAQKDALRQGSVLLLNEEYSYAEALTLWHVNKLHVRKQYGTFADATSWLDNRTGYGLWLLDGCHAVAEIDKAETPDSKRKKTKAYISHAFGFEYASIEKGNSLTPLLHQIDFTHLINQPTLLYRKIFSDLIHNIFKHTISDTRHPANEITLFDWSSSVGAHYKSLLSRMFIVESAVPMITNFSNLRWCTLAITIDVWNLLAHGHRISDIVGYQEAVNQVFLAIKQLVEETYPLGNEIYRDSTGIYFTCPDLTTQQQNAQLASEIQVKINELAVCRLYPEVVPLVAISDHWGQHDKPDEWRDAFLMLQQPRIESHKTITSGQWAAAIPTQSIWNNAAETGLEICPVCGIRPITIQQLKSPYRSQRCLACRKRAESSLSQWVREKDLANKVTPWLDEIADAQDRVALVVARFSLDPWLGGKMVTTLLANIPKNNQADRKQLSPARLHRIWRTTQEFWESISNKHIGTILPRIQRFMLSIQWDISKRPPPIGVLLDGMIDGFPISLWSESHLHCRTTINPKLCGRALERGAVIRVADENGQIYQGEILEDLQPLVTYIPTRTILTTPDQFLALVPGEDALALAQQIADQYACEMGKVRSRLPLDLSLIYFHRKMPLYAVMDAARRFLMEKPSVEEKWIVRDDHQVGKMPIHFTNDCCWEVPTTFGDGSPDGFYPYVGLWDTTAQGEYQANGRAYVHVNRLKPKQEIAVVPSHFSYLWLDNSTRRYSISDGSPDPQNTEIFSTQFQHLEEIAWHTATWEKLVQMPKLSDTALHGVIDLLLEKRQAWKDDHTDDTFKRFANAVLIRSQLTHGAGISEDDVTSGRLFRCFDLHRRIMKRTLADDRGLKQSKIEKETKHV